MSEDVCKVCGTEKELVGPPQHTDVTRCPNNCEAPDDFYCFNCGKALEVLETLSEASYDEKYEKGHCPRCEVTRLRADLHEQNKYIEETEKAMSNRAAAEVLDEIYRRLYDVNMRFDELVSAIEGEETGSPRAVVLTWFKDDFDEIESALNEFKENYYDTTGSDTRSTVRDLRGFGPFV